MTKKSNQIVFFGSGPVAALSLELLLKHHPVSAVVTKPSTMEMMRASLNDQECDIYSVNNKMELNELIESGKLPNYIGVLIDFGIIVSEKVIKYFEHGIINSHFSLLPQWRGADPITFALLSGQARTGVSLMQLDVGMDTGAIIAQADYDIGQDTDAASLTADLIELSDGLLNNCIDEYVRGSIILQDQETAAALMGIDAEPSYSRKLTKADGKIDWHKPARVIEREIRAFIEWPKSHTQIAGIDITITKAEVDTVFKGSPGEYTVLGKQLLFHTADGSLFIKSLKPAGKKEMPIEAFLAGYGSRI